MPTYQYECPRGHITERFYHRPDDAPREVVCNCNHPPMCRRCCGETSRRIISGGAGFITKGDGFYDKGRID